MERHPHPGFCSFFHPLSPDGGGCSTGYPIMHLFVASTTGCPVELTVPFGETADDLKTRISLKLKLQANRFILLHKNRPLTTGKLVDQGVIDGSKLTLVPVIETGLGCSTTRERTMRNVLESLTEVQLNDFLLGRLPLTLSIGIGAHTMYVQLQLSPQQNVKEAHQDKDFKPLRGSELQTGHRTQTTREQQNFGSTSSTGSTSSHTSFLPTCSSDSSSLNECHIQKAESTKYLSSCALPFAVENPGFLPISKPSTTSSLPNCSSPLQANTPLCPARPFSSNPQTSGPPAASICFESCKQSGASIESFVSHSPGVFSGTFSGTLATSRQNNDRSDGISIVLQILQDLLIAAHQNQGASAPPDPCCFASNQNPSQVTAEGQCKSTSRPRLTSVLKQCVSKESQVQHLPTEENKTLHRKLKRLQHLMHQRRFRKRSYRSSHQH